MGIFKEHSYDIVKLYINQIGITIFSMFLYTAVGTIEDSGLFSTLRIVVSIFSILFYFVLVYHIVWELGAKDKIRIDAGRMEENKIKGLKIGLFANSPNFVFVGLALFLFIIYMASGAEVLYTIFGILNGLFRIFVSMYLGMIQGLTNSLGGNLDLTVETILYIAFSAVAALITYLSYLMGLKDKRLFPTTPNKK